MREGVGPSIGRGREVIKESDNSFVMDIKEILAFSLPMSAFSLLISSGVVTINLIVTSLSSCSLYYFQFLVLTKEFECN